jgi:hypothetical protein
MHERGKGILMRESRKFIVKLLSACKIDEDRSFVVFYRCYNLQATDSNSSNGLTISMFRRNYYTFADFPKMYTNVGVNNV